jgi:hypothetical protein
MGIRRFVLRWQRSSQLERRAIVEKQSRDRNFPNGFAFLRCVFWL